MQFRRLENARPVLATLLVMAALVFVGGFLVWLMLPGHWPTDSKGMVVYVASLCMTATTAIIGGFAFINVATLCRATLLARDPVPVAPGARAAGRLPDHDRAQARSRWRWCGRTLEAALEIDYDGPLDVWLLDEGDDDEVKRDVRRARRPPLQPARGAALEPGRPAPYKAKTKHGNYNAWLDAHGDDYDFFVSASTPTTCRCPTSPSASSATSATPTSPSSSARRSTATTTTS